MLRKLLISVLFAVLILALAVGCSSKGSKKEAETTVQIEKAASAEVNAVVETPAEETSQGETADADVADLDLDDVDRASIINPETLIEKFSYAMGVYVSDVYGTDNATAYFDMFKMYYLPELDYYYGYLGIYDYMTEGLLYSFEELNGIIEEYYADYDMRMAALADENLAKAEAFLAENAKKEGVLTTESGLQYEIVRQGDGAMAGEDDSVELDYELTLMDGTVIDSSYARGEHSTFPLSGVIAGFREGVMLMPMGSHYIFYIHPSLGYGDQATGSMDPNSLLIFKVETYSIQGE